VAALFNMIRWLCVPYGFGAERTGAGLPRLHAIGHLLQPSPHQTGKSAGSTGNGQAAARHPVAPSTMPDMSYVQPIGSAPGPMMGTLTVPIDPAQMAPVFVQPTLVAQAWPVQALLESLRRQYLGN
jgi:hypothetical protein